jgi:acyl carrier protein
MTAEDIRNVVVAALRRIAPEVDAATIDGSANMREELDLDSMDFLNLVLAVHDRLGVEIPETDYPRLYTLDGAVSYLEAKRAPRPPDKMP